MAVFPFHTVSYNSTELTQRDTFETPAPGTADDLVHWVEIGSLKQTEDIKALGEALQIHHLIVEDILSPRQMVKLDNYDDCLFLVLKMLRYDEDSGAISTEHVSIVLRQGLVVSVEENGEGIFRGVREKLLSGRDNIRRQGAGFLAYELLDTVVDQYFNVIDQLGDVTDSIQEELISSPTQQTLQRIYFVKRELMFLRKSAYPLRELVGRLLGSDSPLLGQSIRIYLHDVYDHLIQIVDSVETYQDILSNMLDTYLSSISNRTNDTMKVLTIISTIFIPLTFLAGIYGMNFKDIPELSMPHGYGIFWVVSAIIVIFMILFFHKKKWI